MLFSLSGCATYDRCARKFKDISADTVKVIDTVRVAVAGDTIRTAVHDTTRYFFEERERTRLEVRRDSVYTYIECESKPDTVERLVETERIVERHHWKDKERGWPWWAWVLVGVGSFAVLLVVIRIIKPF